MGSVEQSIVVEEPIRTVYDQWTQFEQFPRFMQGVARVEQVDEGHLRWVSEVGGVEREWEAEIVEQVPDSRIAWRSVSGFGNAGTVTFRPRGESTLVEMRMDFDSEGLAERAGEALGVVEARVRGDLERFKDFIEGRGEATGGWRGEI